MATSLETTLNEAAAVSAELGAAERNMKLSAGAFVRDAMANAETTAEQLDHLEAALAGPECDAVIAFLRVMENFVAEPHSPRPPPSDKFAQFARVYGSDASATQLARLGFSTGQVIALAARNAAGKHSDRFGHVDDWRGHLDHIEGLRTKLDGLMKNMGAQVSGADLTVNERGATFAMAPNIELAGQWQEQLLQHAVRQATT